jgi:dihydroorotase
LHEEDPTLSRDGAMHEGSVSALLGVAGIPSVSESTMVARDAALAGYEGGRVHMQHLSCVESVEAVAHAKAQGIEVTCEVSPHHLCLTDEAVRSLDSNVKMNPPLRAESDRIALLDALRDGTIEAIATDHAPHARHEKEAPFEAAPFGVTGLETAFAVLNTRLVRPGLIPLATLIDRMSTGPARIFGIDRPRVAVGATANLVLLDLDREWDVRTDGFRSRSVNSWLLGETLTGSVAMTIAAGATAFQLVRAR